MNKDIAKTAVLKSIFGQDEALGDRQIRVIASTPTPDRVKDVMSPGGCDLTNYRKNPIVLANHDTDHPIGTADVEVKNGRVEALITFAPAGASQKADECCALAKAGILNTVSVGFTPIDAKPLKGGGYSIEKWELMELSLVSVPCNPDAVVVQRSFDMKTSNWKCGASLGLPIIEARENSEDVLTKAGFYGEDRRDIRFAAKGFLAYDASNAGEASAYEIAFATVVDGRLAVNAKSIKSARKQIENVDLPPEVVAKAEAVLSHYEAKIAEAGNVGAAQVKSLWTVAELASIVSALRWVHSDCESEAEYEGDDSAVPGMLLAALRQLGDALVAMTQEEVSELLASAGGEKAFRAMVKSIRAKAGRAISSDNAKKIKAACDQIKSGHDALVVIAQPSNGEDADEPESEEKSLRNYLASLDDELRAMEIEQLRLKAAI